MPTITETRPSTAHSDLPPVVLGVAGFAAAFAAASCCALPLILSTLGIGSAGLAGLAIWAAPYRVLLLICATAFLGAATILLWQQRRTATACASDGVCSRASVRTATTVGIILGGILLVLGYLYA